MLWDGKFSSTFYCKLNDQFGCVFGDFQVFLFHSDWDTLLGALNGKQVYRRWWSFKPSTQWKDLLREQYYHSQMQSKLLMENEKLICWQSGAFPILDHSFAWWILMLVYCRYALKFCTTEDFVSNLTTFSWRCSVCPSDLNQMNNIIYS